MIEPENKQANMFKPSTFLRTHSKKNDSADIQTQVWQCAFEPDPHIAGKHTNIIATCGGSCICFINVVSATVIQKFNSEYTNELFYCLSWGCHYADAASNNILAVSGNSRRVYIIVPNNSQVMRSTLLPGKSHDSVNSLLFHPQIPDILFCALSTGEIVMTRIKLNNREGLLTQIRSLSIDGEIYELAFVIPCSSLLAASSEGLFVWTLDSQLNTDEVEAVRVALPVTTNGANNSSPGRVKTETTHLTDSVVALGNSSLVASKQVMEGQIIVWDLASALASCSMKVRNVKEICVTSACFLDWSNTDNYFMGIGWNDETKMLACGDDKGDIWLYNLEQAIANFEDFVDKPLSVTSILKWPKRVLDKELQKTHKLHVGTYDIVVAQVKLAGQHLVAVTNNNLVSLWHRQSM